MEIGKRIRTARQEAGLSQRQLCGDQITRNMLTQIENGAAVPSLQTLSYLAQRLGKPVGWFFGEESSPERAAADRAWQAWEAGNPTEAARILDGSPQMTFRDLPYLKSLVLLELAEQAIRDNRQPYGEKMIGWAEENLNKLPQLARACQLLRGQLDNRDPLEICRKLPSLDGELQLRAEAALSLGDNRRAGCLLDAAENQKTPEWLLLRGRVCLSRGEYRQAARYFHGAEQSLPGETAPYLEQCYRELGDFRQAYLYACRQK